MKETVVEVKDVSIKFNMSSEKYDSFKEYIIKMIKQQITYHSFWALKNVSFEVKKGDTLALLVIECFIKLSGIYLPTPESFCVQPYRYLLKQSKPSEIQKELRTILKYTQERKGKKYFIAEDDGMYQKIDIDEILYFSIIRRGCEIHILQNGAGKILRTRKRIEEIEAELRKEYFCRIHKSFLVNPRYITEVKKSEIKMENNEILSVSKAKRKAFEDMFAEYLSYRNQT